jgi:proliferating cell nuclear antigen
VSRAVAAADRDDDLQPEARDASVASLLTFGDPIRSWTRLVEPITDELRVTFDADGMHVRAVDPPDVSMLLLNAHADGFERFEAAGETTVGLDLDKFASAVGWARKRGGDGDPVGIDVFDDPPRIRVSVTWPNQSMKRISEWFTIDPDSLRDRPDVPDLEFPHRAAPDVRALSDAVDAVADAHDHVDLSRDGDTLVLGAEDDEGEETVYLPGAAWDDREDAPAGSPATTFSLDYFTDLAAALRRSKADRVTLKWAHEYPLKLSFQHRDWGFDGTMMLAPRIEGGHDA